MSQQESAPLVVAPFRLDSLQASGPAEGAPRPGDAERGAKGRHARRARASRRWRRVAVVLVVLAVAAGGTVAGVRLSARQPEAVASAALPRSVPVPDDPVSLPWPSSGQAAVSIPALGVVRTSGPERPVPVASMTKLMTAAVIVHDHPLELGAQGPLVTVSAADVSDYRADNAANDSNVAVSAGEQLSEAQLLAGLLVHSADNYADILANWDAGSIPAFVAKMNATAARLGMAHSHFADASGLDNGSVSTPSDILKVAALDLVNPVVAADVRMPAVTLPVAGVVTTFTPFVGLFGVVGVKSGYTPAAGGCDVLAAVRRVHGAPVLLLAAITGQTGAAPVVEAGMHGLALVSAMVQHVGSIQVVRRGEVVAQVSRGGRAAPALAESSTSVLTWPGVTVRRRYVDAPGAGARTTRGDTVGTVVVTAGTQRVAVPARLGRDVPPEPLLARLF